MATVNDTLTPQLLYLTSSKLNSHLLTLSHQSSFLRGHVHLCTCLCNTHVHINTYTYSIIDLPTLLWILIFLKYGFCMNFFLLPLFLYSFLSSLPFTTEFSPPDSSVGKESSCNAGDPGSIPGLGRSAGETLDDQLQYSGLENSMDFIVHRLQRVGYDWVTFTFTEICT